MIAPRCPLCGGRLSRAPCPAEAREDGGLVTVDWPMACEECMRGFVLRTECAAVRAVLMDGQGSVVLAEVPVTAGAHRPHQNI